MGYKRSQETKKRNEHLYAETMRHYGNGVYFDKKRVGILDIGNFEELNL